MVNLRGRIERMEGSKTTERTWIWPLLSKPGRSIVLRPGMDSLELPDEEVARRFPDGEPVRFTIGEADVLAGPDLGGERTGDFEEIEDAPALAPMLPAPRPAARQSPAEPDESSPPQEAPSESPPGGADSQSQRRQAAHLETTFR